MPEGGDEPPNLAVHMAVPTAFVSMCGLIFGVVAVGFAPRAALIALQAGSLVCLLACGGLVLWRPRAPRALACGLVLALLQNGLMLMGGLLEPGLQGPGLLLCLALGGVDLLAWLVLAAAMTRQACRRGARTYSRIP